MSNHKDLINQAIHNYYHEDTELEMELKDKIAELYYKSKTFDKLEKILNKYDISDMNNDDYIKWSDFKKELDYILWLYDEGMIERPKSDSNSSYYSACSSAQQ